MPGPGGPRVILGVGFWAQQEYFGILPSPDGTKIFRPILKSLPDQPFPPNAFQSWTYSYNLNLIGQDQMVVGEQRWELPPSQTPYELTRNFTWQWNTPLSLYFQAPGRPLVGAMWDLLPPAYFIPYRIDQTWARSYNLNLIGQDKLPTGKAIFELPPRDYLRLQDLRTWLQGTTALTLAPPPVVRPIVQSDWPLPQTPARLDQFWSETFQQTPPPADTTHILRGIWRSLPDQPPLPLQQQSAFPNYLVLQPTVVTYIIRQSDWPVPRAPQLGAFTWTWSYNLNLIGQDKLPAGEQVSDRPTLPVPPAQTWAVSYNLSLIGQDKLPTGEQTTELPPRDFPRLFQTWINTANLSLVTAPPDLTRQVHIFDYPNPRGAEPDWRRSWEFSYNKNLIGQDQLPFRQQDWPLTRAVDRAGEWIQQTALALTAAAPRPFVQSDWPNPTQPFRDPTLRAWAPPLNIGLLAPQPLLPPLYLRNQDWPNPRGPIYPSDLRAWPIQGSPAPIIPGVPPPPPVGPAVYNKPMLAGPGYLNVIPGEKPS